MSNLAQLAEKLRNQGAGFSSQPLIDIAPPCPHEHWDSTPISDEEFVKRLPDKIIDPKTGKEIFISQSKIKKMRKLAKDELCPKRFYHTSLAETAKEIGTRAMALGRRFEFELSGALDYDGEEPLKISGKLGERLSKNAKTAKETLERLGIPLDRFDKNLKYKFKCLSGSPDLQQEGDNLVLVIDVKYSSSIGNRDAKWNEYGWDPETLSDKFTLVIQPCQYDLLGRLIYGKPVDFMFMVFHSGDKHEGEYLPIKISISEDRRNQHKNLVLHVIEEIQNSFNGEGFKAIPSYRKGFCKDCPVKSCSSRVLHPSIVEVIV